MEKSCSVIYAVGGGGGGGGSTCWCLNHILSAAADSALELVQ